MFIDEQRIILINGSRLFGDMLHNVIRKADHLEVVQEVNWQEELPAAIENTEAEWVLILSPFDTNFPPWVDGYSTIHPCTRFLVISIGSGTVRLKSLNSPKEQLEDPSLDDLMHVLERHPQQLEEK